MKIRGVLFISLLAALVSLRAADPKVEFSGVLTADGKTKLALTNKTTGATTWVEPGESYQGYTVARYDPKEDAVFLKKDGEETRLGLVAAKSPAANTAATSPSTDVAATAIRTNLRLLAAAARRYQLDRGVTTVTYADLVGPGKSIPELRSVAGENYSSLTFPSGGSTVGVAMTDGTQVSVDVPAVTSPAPATVAQTTNVAVPPPTPTPSTPAPTEPLPTASNAAAPSQALEPTGRPAETPSSYTTAANETWETVAQKNGVTVDQLKELNPTVISPSSLPEGQPLRIRK